MQRVFWKRYASLLAIGITLACPVQACLNDRDTDLITEELAKYGKPSFALTTSGSPATEAGLPDLAAVLTGRFDRNPALYYEMRIARISQELKAVPAQLALYDDIGVANDRIGKSDIAMQWMERKRKQLGKTTPDDPARQEDWYRYYANLGTFRIHNWLKHGADPKQIGAVRQARTEIAKAIAIKPDAHFGRERYQLMVMDWLLTVRTPNPPKRVEPVTLGGFIHQQDKAPESERITGLAGLIALGNAWESVDVFHAITQSLRDSEDHHLAVLAALRAQELLEAHKKTLCPALSETISDEITCYAFDMENLPGQSLALHMRQYKEHREFAEKQHKMRTEYMLARLRQGRHPDTDSAFWKDWHPAVGPTLEPTEEERKSVKQDRVKKRDAHVRSRIWEYVAYAIIGLFWAGIVLGIFKLIRYWKRRAG